ncbi:hypothetical protein F5Y16DRAFT_410843 [Xylariaceae sp. FL0255]|nr:hypothetical protein F5Y16DRAFT_410843 [Xylariaceae sp. FL0255]
MQMTLFWTSLTSIVYLAAASPVNPLSSDLDKRGSSIIIGFRSVAAAEAQIYQQNGNFLKYSTTGGPAHRIDQLGPGAYLSPSPGEWPAQWICVVQADSDFFAGLNKAWVPETMNNGCTPLWDNVGAPNRPGFLSNVMPGRGFTTSNTMLFSIIARVNNNPRQMLIPQSLVNSNPQAFKVNCALDQEGLAEREAIYGLAGNVVDWDTLGIAGVPQP